jgi:hypothetical protein
MIFPIFLLTLLAAITHAATPRAPAQMLDIVAAICVAHHFSFYLQIFDCGIRWVRVVYLHYNVSVGHVKIFLGSERLIHEIKHWDTVSVVGNERIYSSDKIQAFVELFSVE